MLHWLLIISAVFFVILIFNRYKNNLAAHKRLSVIREKWGKPVEADRNFNLICRYLITLDDTATISGETASDLDTDGVFSFIDRTNSKPGQQYLYKRLHTIETAAGAFDALEEEIEALCSDESVREQVEVKLAELNNNDAYSLPELFSKKHASFFSGLTAFYIRISPVILVSLIVLLSTHPNAGWLFLLLTQLIVNTGIHFANKTNILAYTNSLPQLLILGNVAQWLAKQGFLEQGNEVKSSLAKVLKLKKSLSLINFQNKVANDPTDLVYLINEWFRILFLSQPLIFISSIKKVNKYLDEIKTVYEAVAKVDVTITIQSVREGLPYYCKPDFTANDDNLIVSSLYHPLIENCVCNSISSNNGRIALITGSNMSGKTTFIRAVAINALLAQTIHTCCAETYQSPPLKILTCINMSDDMNENKSYFQAEALSILDIVNKSSLNEPVKSLVIIDEIFRGTNTIERVAAAMSVLSYLVDNKNFVFVSTHDLELAELLDNKTVYSFEEQMIDGKLTFDYKIKEGLLKNKNGIAVLQRLGYPDDIINKAYKASEQLWDKYRL